MLGNLSRINGGTDPSKIAEGSGGELGFSSPLSMGSSGLGIEGRSLVDDNSLTGFMQRTGCGNVMYSNVLVARLLQSQDINSIWYTPYQIIASLTMCKHAKKQLNISRAESLGSRETC